MSTNDPSVPIDVDLTRSTNGVWLVKMPKYLSQILNDHAEGAVNGEVGRLVKRPPQTTKGSAPAPPGGRAQDVVFCLSDQIMERLKQQNPSKDYQLPPREHRFCLSNISDGILRTIYTRTLNSSNAPSSEQIALVGKVIQRAEVRPVENEQYMTMKRHQFEASQEPARKAQMIVKKTNLYAPKRFHEERRQQEKMKKLMGKRVRSSEDKVLNLMFEAFSKHQFISMSSLEGITNEPKSSLQQLVKRYCNYNNSGHTYELKPQFRHYSAPKEDEEEDNDMDDDDDDDDDNNNNDVNT